MGRITRFLREKYILFKMTGGEPVSKIFSVYVDHLVKEFNRKERFSHGDDLKSISGLPSEIWNAVVLDDYYPLAFGGNAVSGMLDIFPGRMNHANIEFWVRRKRIGFFKYRFLIQECDVYTSIDNGIVVTATCFLPKEVSNIYGIYGDRSIG